MQLSRDAIQRMIGGVSLSGGSSISGGGGTGGVVALYECSDVARDGNKVSGAATGKVLRYGSDGKWYADEMTISKISGLQDALNAKLDIAFFSSLFKAYAGTDEVTPNNSTANVDNIKAMFGFWTEQYISARGRGAGGGGGGGTGNVTWDELAGTAATGRKVDISYLTDAIDTLTGYTTSGRNYAVQLNENNQMYVNVPWTDHYAWSDITGKPSATGGATQPIYWNGSSFVATTYTLGKSVPADAVFTDHYAWADITGKPLTLTKNATGFSISGGTTSKTLTVAESYALGAACAKGVTDNSSATAVTNTDTNLITGRTLYYAGYIKSTDSITGTASNVTGTVAIDHGGTGATTAAAARANLSVPALISDSYPTLIAADGSTNNWIKIGTANGSYGLIPSQQGTAGNGHNYLGTSYWYWGYAYIDNIYGYLYGTGATLSGDLALNNTISLCCKDSGGTARGVLMMTSVNQLCVGYGSADASYDTYLDGYKIHFRNSASHTENMTLTEAGRVGIGTTTPGAKIGVAGSNNGGYGEWAGYFDGYTQSGVYLSYSGGEAMFVNTKANSDSTYVAKFCYGATSLGTAANTAMTIMSNGKVGIGTDSPAHALSVAGNIVCTGCLTGRQTSVSDIRMKRVLSYEVPLTLVQIANAPTIMYRWKQGEDQDVHVGSIAQYWRSVIPEATWKTNEDVLTMQEGTIALIGITKIARELVAAQKKIKELERRLNHGS